MRKTQLFIILSVIVLIFAFVSCKTSTEPGDNKLSKNGLFRATLTNTYLQDDVVGIIFISDTDGNVLVDTMFIGDANIKVAVPSWMKEIPQKVSATLVYASDSEQDYIYLRTFLNIPISSAFTFEGYEYPENEITIELLNVPSSDGYLILSTDGHGVKKSFSDLANGSQIDLDYSDSDVYCMLNTLQEPATYGWLSGIQTDYVNVLDLSTVTTATTHATIAFPTDAFIGFAQIVGYSNNYENAWLLDWNDFDSGTPEVNMYYPSSGITNIAAGMYYTNADYDKYWANYTYTSIPSSFKKIDADYAYLDMNADNFEILVSGKFIRGNASWGYSGYDRYYSWSVISSGEQTSYRLPDISNAVEQLYPDIDRSEFELIYFYIRDYLGVSSYAAYLELVYNSSTPYEQGVEEVYELEKSITSAKNKNGSAVDWEKRIEERKKDH